MKQASELTKRQLAILRKLAQGMELVYDGGMTAYLGTEHVAPRTLNALIRAMALHSTAYPGTEIERYMINHVGRQILESSSTERVG